MGQGGPVGGNRGDSTARIRIDLSQFQAAPNVARQAGQAVSRELREAFRLAQAEQKLLIAQTQQATVQLRGQQNQITQVARAESVERQQLARAEAQVRSQQARAAANAAIEAERRATAQFRSELRTREAAARSARTASFAAAGGPGFARQAAGAALGGLGGGIGTLAGVGIAAGVGLGVVQLGRAALAAEQTATAYRRQEVAAVSLAGSQQKLNGLMDAYTRATGGAVDRATALQQVTQLQAIGFGDSAQELERFVRIARGISIATGRTQEFVTQELAMTLANVSERRLDQIGLSITEVDERVQALQASNKGLTRDMAFQQAVLDAAEDKYAALTRSAEGQATGVESLRRAWTDFGLELGQIVRGPINAAARGLAGATDAATEGVRNLRQTGQTSVIRGGISLRTNAAGAEAILAGLEAQRARVLADMESGARPMAVLQADLAELDAKIKAVNVSLGSLDTTARMANFGSRTGIGANIRQPATLGGFEPAQLEAMQEWAAAVQDIERSANQQRIDATRQYESQRTSLIANYEKSIAREAEDFARSRANAERKHQLAILDVQQDAARQRAKWEADLARRIQEMQADSAEKRAEWEEERGERIADVRQDSAERLQELEEDYARSRERAAAEHRDNLLSAAGRLDAIALQEEQRRFAREQQEAAEDHQKRVDDEKEAEQERIDEINAAHAERLEDEREALEKSIRQAQEAHQRQLEEQEEATRLRLEEMQAAFEEQRTQEDIERGIRLQRQAQDHNEQLIELERQHGERIAQIGRHAFDERRALDEAFKDQLIDLGLFWDGWEEVQKRRQDDAIDLFDDWWDEINKRFDPEQQGAPGTAITPGNRPSGTPTRAFASGGFVPSTGPAILHAGEYVLNPNAARLLADAMGGLPGMPARGGTNMGGVTINMAITGGPNASAPDIAREVRQALMGEFERLGYGA